MNKPSGGQGCIPKRLLGRPDEALGGGHNTKGHCHPRASSAKTRGFHTQLDEGPDMEQHTVSKQEKEYVKAVCCHPAYLTSMQRNADLE